jgi:hypothetical protein
VDWRADVWRRFLRDLPWTIVVWVVVTAVLFAYSHVRGEPIDEPVAFLFALAIVAFAVTPLVWIRWESPLVCGPHSRRRSALVWAVGCLWIPVGLVVGVAVVALLGVD